MVLPKNQLSDNELNSLRSVLHTHLKAKANVGI